MILQHSAYTTPPAPWWKQQIDCLPLAWFHLNGWIQLSHTTTGPISALWPLLPNAAAVTLPLQSRLTHQEPTALCSPLTSCSLKEVADSRLSRLSSFGASRPSFFSCCCFSLDAGVLALMEWSSWLLGPGELSWKSNLKCKIWRTKFT